MTATEGTMDTNSREATTSIRDTFAVLGGEINSLVEHLTAILNTETVNDADVLRAELAIEREAHLVTIANRDQLRADLDDLREVMQSETLLVVDVDEEPTPTPGADLRGLDMEPS